MRYKEVLWVQGPTIISGVLIIIILSVISLVRGGTDVALNSNSGIEESSVMYNIKSSAVATEKFDFSNTQSDSMAVAYADIIQGTYIINDSLMYDFGRNSAFSGFFDSANSYVQNYTYKVIMDGNVPYIYIIDPDNSKMVSYKLIVKDDKISLLYEENGLLIELE